MYFSQRILRLNICSVALCPFREPACSSSDNILRLWLEPVKDDLQHDFAWVADEAECPCSFDTIVGCRFLEV